MFKFIHAADIHLDSPLKGLDKYDGAPVEEIRSATRRAFENLVELAIESPVNFVLIAGDLYDGDWKDFSTGRYFSEQMSRLRAAKIPAFIIAGNHDAANRMTKALTLPDNVRMFSHKKPETMRLEDIGVAIHGQSFAKSAVLDDLAAGYPSAISGEFNIGLLHTSATGRTGHEPYAPCTINELLSKQYDYWALGHVHKYEELHQDPPIVFPGNLQGRHVREAGSKGCVLVTVDERGRPDVQWHCTDVFRWAVCQVDATDAETRADLLERVSEQFDLAISQADDRPLAVRVEIEGPCPAHESVAAEPLRWDQEVRAAAGDRSGGNVWVEKVKSKTSLPVDMMAAQETDGPVGELVRFISELREDDDALNVLSSEELAAIKKALPRELTEGADAIGLDRSDVMQDVLDQVQQMLVRRLLVKEDVE